MKNPIYIETMDYERPIGFGCANVPMTIQNGQLWQGLVMTSEDTHEKISHQIRCNQWRYKEHPKYLLPFALAKMAQELYPGAVVLADPYLIQMYCQTRDKMREAYIHFVETYKRGCISHSGSLRTTLHQILKEAA